MVKKIKINEEQYIRLFQEDFSWDETSDTPTLHFDVNRPNNYASNNDTRKYYNDSHRRLDNEALVMKPTVIKLNRSKLDCYALFNLQKIELQQAIKHNTWGTHGGQVKWDNREEFLNYAASYAQELIENIFHRLQSTNKQLKLKYIAYPQSSTKFNKEFCQMIKDKLNANIEIVDDLFFKSKCGIQVDYDTAQYLGCSAEEVANLEVWAREMEYVDKISFFRKDVLYLLRGNRPQTALGGRGVDTDFYNWTNSKQKAKDKSSDYLKNTDYHTYVATAATSTQRKYLNHPSYTPLKLNNGEYLDIPNGVYATLTKIKTSIDKIISSYKDFDKCLKHIEQKANNYAQKQNDGNNVNLTNNEDKYQHLDDSAESSNNEWQIKKKGEWARRILRNLFQINQNKSKYFSKEDYETSVIVIFDDNVSGGASMDNVCYAIEEIGWKHIIPLTLSAMPMALGDRTQFAKQLERDRRSGFSLKDKVEKEERKNKYFAQDYNDGEEIHNISHFGDDNYDYEHKSNFNLPSHQLPNYVHVQKGTKITPNLDYNNYHIDNVLSLHSIEDLKNYLANTQQKTTPKGLQSLWNKVIAKQNKL